MNSPTNFDNRVRSALARSLKLNGSDKNGPLQMGTTPGWDSLGHINVLLELEREFHVSLPAFALAKLVDVPSIVKIIAEFSPTNKLRPTE
jgi:acyl carrier protein